MRPFTVEALVDNDDRRLKPGFFAKGVIFTKKDEDVLAVPDSAVSTLETLARADAAWMGQPFHGTRVAISQ